MPSLISPRIFPFFIFKTEPSYMWSVEPIVATRTVCPFETLGAPQTIESKFSLPMSTFVSFSLSALGCFSHFTISPTKTPSNPPFTLSYFSTCSTSKPMFVSKLEISSIGRSISMNCFNQL